MLPKFFDIHTHVNDVRFNEDRADVLARTHAQGVFMINVGTDKKSSEDVVAMADASSEGVFAAIGVHPNDDRTATFDKEAFAAMAKNPRVVAIGECGLDYSRIAEGEDVVAEKLRQKELFEAQVDFAIERNLPVMIHCRDSLATPADAHHDVLAILSEKKKDAGARLHGDVHFFSQTTEIAREYFALDFTISFTGVITFARDYDEVIRNAPLDRIMAETDAPYVSPVPYRGKRNEPLYVEEVVKKIAEIRGEDFETVRSALVENAFRTFNISRA